MTRRDIQKEIEIEIETDTDRQLNSDGETDRPKDRQPDKVEKEAAFPRNPPEVVFRAPKKRPLSLPWTWRSRKK